MKIIKSAGPLRPLGELEDGDAFAMPGNDQALFIATDQYDIAGTGEELRGAVELNTGRFGLWAVDRLVLVKPNAQAIEDSGEASS